MEDIQIDDTIPEHVSEFIIDNIQHYGNHFWTFPHLEQAQLTPLLNNGTHPLYCVYMPIVVKHPKFESCGFVAVPTLWQGIPGRLEIYHEPATDDILGALELVPCFEQNLYNTGVANNLYNRKLDIKIIKKRLEKYKQQNQPQIQTGYLVRLNAEKVPYASKFPIARIVSVIKHAKGGFDCKIIHQKIQNNKIISIPHSGGWIYTSYVQSILSTSTDRNIHFGIYNQQISQRALERRAQLKKQVKKDKENELNEIMINYLGLKIKNCLNETNFKKLVKYNKMRKKVCIVEQEMRKATVEDQLISKLKKNKIPHKNNKSYLKVTFETPKQLAKIIGRQNIMNQKSGFEYFIAYPVEMTYGYKWVFPRIQVEFNVHDRNRAGNFER